MSNDDLDEHAVDNADADNDRTDEVAEPDRDSHGEPDTQAHDEPNNPETDTDDPDEDEAADQEMPEAVHKVLVATLGRELTNANAGFGPAALEICGYRLDEFITGEGEIAGTALRQAINEVKERLQLKTPVNTLPQVSLYGHEPARPEPTWANALRNY